MNRKQILINEIASLVLQKLNEHAEIDKLLDKIFKSGEASLTPSEKEYLDYYARTDKLMYTEFDEWDHLLDTIWGPVNSLKTAVAQFQTELTFKKAQEAWQHVEQALEESKSALEYLDIAGRESRFKPKNFNSSHSDSLPYILFHLDETYASLIDLKEDKYPPRSPEVEEQVLELHFFIKLLHRYISHQLNTLQN